MQASFVLIIVLAYFALLLSISFFQRKNRGENEAFFRGNRQSPWWVVAIGMVGASLSGISFVSVPGMVRGNDMLYMQTVMGFFVGYLLIAHFLLPIYYKMNAPSIYVYLQQRFGNRSYKTGASFFLLSKTIGAAARLYVVAIILQTFLFDALHVPFCLGVTLILLMIWLYTSQTGIKTIVWTDMLQTLFMLAALLLIVFRLAQSLGYGWADGLRAIVSDDHFHWFEWRDWTDRQHFLKQFLSGIFIVVVMTGLDQDMMQKNLSIQQLKESKRNLATYGFAFLPVNLLFLTLGILLLQYAQRNGIELPNASDDILPFIASDYLGKAVGLFFIIGIVSAAFSSADSALTALTTSVCVDLVGRQNDVSLRRRVHLLMCVAVWLIIMVFRLVNNTSLIDAIYVVAGYTYGPLLGLFAFGLCTKRPANDAWTPFIAVASPLLCALLQYLSTTFLHYTFGYELLMLNGLFTFAALWWSGKNLSKNLHNGNKLIAIRHQ